jgi:hypothetical protein
MSAVLSPRQANITNYNDQSPTRDEDAIHFSPHLIDVLDELFVIRDAPKLVRVLGILFEAPIGRARDHKVNRFIWNSREAAAIVDSRNLMATQIYKRLFDSIHILFLLCQIWNGLLTTALKNFLNLFVEILT